MSVETRTETLLKLEDVRAMRGPVHAVNGVSLEVAPGESVAVLGPNGAGKTSLLRVIAGLTPTTSGQIVYEQGSLVGLSPHRRAARHISLVPEDRALFPDLSVRDNITLGAFSAVPRSGARRAAREIVDRLIGEFPLLAKLEDRPAAGLSGGEAQLVAIVRSLATDPRLLLLDEPATGLAPIVLEQLREWIHTARANGIAVLVAEQNVKFALQLASRVYLLAHGKVVFAGDSAEFLDQVDAFSAYLGDAGTRGVRDA